MSKYQNHVIDPTFFYDAIEEFAFDYTCFIVKDVEYDEEGNTIYKWSHQIVRGSFQRDMTKRSKSKSGSTDSADSHFYCKSLYRLNMGDVIEYHHNYYMIDGVNDYDEFGVRECELKMIQLTKYRDLCDYIKYIRGEKLV